MLRVGLALLFGTLMSPLVRAQPMAEAGTQLADLISSLLQRRATVSLEFQNPAAIAPAELSSFRAALQQELRKTGVETTTAAQPETLRVTISENVRGLLFVAAVSCGREPAGCDAAVELAPGHRAKAASEDLDPADAGAIRAGAGYSAGGFRF